ncbi:hypothetical protein CAPTEDRAFT_150704 [Capitella teleta]|uniref:Probable ATP-dependent RNA helicase DDX56 n=1 Tax=Capitella teleta TaxID=283909 RepID=R7V4G8_CAPTE|nr:hypothetical protein CAPTEDRAFT_150704 [Capitella teleta]|eukprot:ELU13728.1 hypothetical protein CAPTEDRAFT_150704 [Capitella teleta]
MEEQEEKLIEFHEMGLDDRILKAVAKLGWMHPTLIQEKAIPLALNGKDILARARTGSGKTAAYVIPVLQKILSSKLTASEQCIRALILTPTRELCNQVSKNIAELCLSCSREVSTIDISGQMSLESQKPMLAEKPDIVVSTPSRILLHLQAGTLSLKESLEFLVIDEADLVFSFGYESDLQAIKSYLPRIYQAFLMSATLSEDVKSLKSMVLHNAVILKLEDSSLPTSAKLSQYHIRCEEDEKYVILYSMLKLRLIRGKTLLFVNTVDKCYRLKLFLEQFQIASCVLNSELPVNSRCHIVSQFNSGFYDIIIASDEVALETPSEVKKTKKKTKGKDKESGISRGIDFQYVSNVINFDLPLDADSYIHRVGRTARGDNEGTALSFIAVKDQERQMEIEAALSDGLPKGEQVLKPYLFKMKEIEGFQYRAQDALKAVTKVAVKNTRMNEIKKELLNSQKLKLYFKDNPRDQQVLRHDRRSTNKVQGHLQNVPNYLVPPTLRKYNLGSKGRRQPKAAASISRAPSRKRQAANPLNTFKFSGLKKTFKKARKK